MKIMKYQVDSPLAAALAAGGCTLEPEIGWWTFSTGLMTGIGSELVDGLGVRDAVYIPTLQKNGLPVNTRQINKIKEVARAMGFINETPASGMWVLSETGEVQIEYIWILWTTKTHRQFPRYLPVLAERVKLVTNQDSVAYELGGILNFV